MLKTLTMTWIAVALLALSAERSYPGENAVPEKKAEEDQSKKPQLLLSASFAPSADETRLSILLTSRSVQYEIGVSKDQAVKIAKLYDQQVDRSWPVMMHLRSTQDEAKRAEIQAVLHQFTLQCNQEIKAALPSSKAQRLVQIAIQNGGLHAFDMPEVLEGLNLAPDQVDSIQEIRDDLKETQAVLQKTYDLANADEYERLYVNNARPPKGEFQKSKSFLDRRARYVRESAANEAAARREIFRVLTKGQKRKFERLRGEPFDPEKYRKIDAERSK